MSISKFISKDSSLRIYVIGDPHFRAKFLKEGDEFIEKCVKSVSLLKPDYIIVLGDVLDTHETAKNSPFKSACTFIERLSLITHTFILIGNHDLINKSQFLTDNHFFNPLKKWKNVTIVDHVVRLSIKDEKSSKVLYDFVMCPYVENGRFHEALSTINSESFNYRNASCIFAHQEIKGVNMSISNDNSEIISMNGDTWNSEYPLLICGHIHIPQKVSSNVHYVGSAVQVSFNEPPNKRVWLLTFSLKGRKTKLKTGYEKLYEQSTFKVFVNKIDLRIRQRHEMKIDYQDLKTQEILDEIHENAEKFIFKLTIRGTPDQFTILKTKQMFMNLKKRCSKVVCEPKFTVNNLQTKLFSVDGDTGKNQEILQENSTNFSHILKFLVSNEKNSYLDEIFRNLFET